MKIWKVLSSRKLHSTRWIEIVEDSCEWQGQKFVYTYTKRVDEGPLIIPEEDGKLWMVKQYRHPIRKEVWQFPAEGKHVGENWLETAKRGLAEELGIKAQKWVDLGILHPDPGGLQQTARVYLATNLSQADATHTSDPLEELEAGLFSLEDIERLVEKEEICDGWTFACLYKYQRYLAGVKEIE